LLFAAIRRRISTAMLGYVHGDPDDPDENAAGFWGYSSHILMEFLKY
jgi:hypothetical protein